MVATAKASFPPFVERRTPNSGLLLALRGPRGKTNDGKIRRRTGKVKEGPGCVLMACEAPLRILWNVLDQSMGAKYANVAW